MLVMKFGGTSVGSAECMAAVAEIIGQVRGQHPRLVVVVSAMSGVTDQLISAARQAAEGRVEECEAIQASLLAWHMGVCHSLLVDADQRCRMGTCITERMAELEWFCQSVAVRGEVTVRGLDMVSAIGEKLSAAILSALLQTRGMPAEYMDASRVLVTDDHFGGANPLLAETKARLEEHLRPLVERGVVPIVTGYIGATARGVPTTLGRGGGDYSAAIIGACMEANEVCIWSDVDGILTADPNVVPEARTLEELSYVEAAELAYFGAEVLHPKTIKPVEERSIPLRIRNTFNPCHPGTLIVKEPSAGRSPTRAIISTRGLSLLSVRGSEDAWTPQVAARVLRCLGRAGVEVLMFTQSFSERNLTLLVWQRELSSGLRLLRGEFADELARGLIAPPEVRQKVATVSVVGGPSKDGQGVVPQTFAALGRQRTPVIAIAQASSEYNVSFVVPEDEMADTVQALHGELMG